METNLPTTENTLPAEQGAGAVAVASRTQAEIQSQIAVAKRFPRDEAAAYAKAVRAFESPMLADEAIYDLKFGNKPVNGPSVHAARVLARCWTSVNYGCDCLSEDEQGAQLRGYAHDLENNVRPTQEAYVRRLVPRKNYRTGITEYVRPSELEWQREKNKQGAILERNCLLKLFPRDMVDECMEIARRAAEKSTDSKLKTSRASFTRKLVQQFDEIGVSAKMLERFLGHGIDLMDKREATELQGIYKAIRDGQASRTDYFTFTEKAEETDLSEADNPAS